MLEIKDIHFSYSSSKPIIQGLSLKIKRGQFVSIIGANGSGKSTLAKLIVGLLEVNSGSIKLNEIAITEESLPLIREKVGMVFQNPDNQFIGSTVKDDIAFGLENRCIDPSLMPTIIQEYAMKVNMLEYLDKEPVNLSGGQKQRVAIASILSLNYEYIIFDEATSMLDPQAKKEINTLIRSLNKDNQTTVLNITHDLEEVIDSDYVYVLDQGQIVLEGTPKTILFQTERLRSLDLDVPFVVRLIQDLKKEGISLEPDLNLERVLERLCQLSIKK